MTTHASAKPDWFKANNSQRQKMLKNAGYDHHRTYTLRRFEDLPIEVKLDLNYLVSRPAGAPTPAQPASGVSL